MLPRIHDDSHRGLVRSEFDAMLACRTAHDACLTYGVDEGALIETLGSASPEQRTEISARHRELYRTELKTTIKRKCPGNDFGRALQLLALPPSVAEAKLVKMALGRMGVAVNQLYPILCGRTRADIRELKRAYLETYNRELGAVAHSMKGDFRTLLTTCLEVEDEAFDDGLYKRQKPEHDAEDIFVAFKGKRGNYAQVPFNILCASPRAHLEAVNSACTRKYGMSLRETFDKKLSGTARRAAIFALDMKLAPHDAVAQLIRGICSGIHIDSLLLTSCLIRYQPIMGDVSKVYQELFDQSIGEAVASRTKGSFRKLLLRLLNASTAGWASDGSRQQPQYIRSVRVNIPPWAEPGDRLNVYLGDDKKTSVVVIPDRHQWHRDAENNGGAAQRTTRFFLHPVAEVIMSVQAI
mmetsp:Transcript_23667/g.43737  ORF Transcript_23667/g.43737 Transcript_23667/m.43737 type:complete len:410 (-) Transcript_23667:900-2129(-)